MIPKSIIDLCRSLPGSEPELRARADEFNSLLSEIVFSKPSLGLAEVTFIDGDTDVWARPFHGFGVQKPVRLDECMCGEFTRTDDDKIFGHSTHCLTPVPDYLNSIAAAKAATDAMTGRGCGHYMREIYDGRRRLVRWRIYFPHGQMIDLERYAEAAALTEELARSAACVLAAEAMRQSAK